MNNINKTISELIDDYGMQRILQALIDNLEKYDEDYIIKLKQDLEIANTNYLNRHSRYPYNIGDTLVFDIDAVDETLPEALIRQYYGHLYNLDNPDKPYLFTFIAEHRPQSGHCILINMQNQKIEIMRHIDDFRLITEEECQDV